MKNPINKQKINININICVKVGIGWIPVIHEANGDKGE